jgi:hypothetical protein
MKMDDAAVLPANAVCVSVMHMVNPSTFWMTEPLGQHVTEERDKLTYLEEILSGHCRRSYVGVNYAPEEEEVTFFSYINYEASSDFSSVNVHFFV